MAEIIIPAMSDDENKKIIEAVKAIGDCMDTDIAIEKIASVKITFSSMRGDVRTILTDLVEAKTKRKVSRGKDIKIGNPSDDFIESKNP